MNILVTGAKGFVGKNLVEIGGNSVADGVLGEAAKVKHVFNIYVAQRLFIAARDYLVNTAANRAES